MEKITYGAPRLVDWVAQIKAGAATVRVHFTGGALTTYGVTPAEYTTANPFIQKVIENSTYFKEGRIIKLRTTEIADTQKPKPRKAKASESELIAKATAQADEPSLHSAHNPDPIDLELKLQHNGLEKVEVTCLQDAQAYLQENFGISSYKVRTYEAAQRAAAEHGIQFTGGKFGELIAEATAQEDE